MDIGSVLKDNVKAFLPILGLIAVIIAFYAFDVSSGSFTSFAPTVREEQKKTESFEYEAKFDTTYGTFVVELQNDFAPKNTENFVSLAEDGFYNNMRFHRVIKNFIIQTGDSKGDGKGTAGHYIKDEIAKDLKFRPYLVAMANEGKPNTNSSQFFITLPGGDFTHLDGNYTIIGEVTEGRTVVEEIGNVSVDSDFSPVRDVLLRDIVITKDRKK